MEVFTRRWYQTWEKVLDFRLLNLIATVIDFCTPPTEQGRGHPRSATVRGLATLRQFLREGTPWRSLKRTADKVSGSTLRRHLEQWAQIGLLAQVHADPGGGRPKRRRGQRRSASGQ